MTVVKSEVPRTCLWTVSEVSLCSLDVVGDGWSYAGDQRVDSEDRHDDQRHGDDQSQPEQCRGPEHTDSGTVLRIQRPDIGHEHIAEHEVEHTTAPDSDLIEQCPVPCRQTTLQTTTTHITDSTILQRIAGLHVNGRQYSYSNGQCFSGPDPGADTLPWATVVPSYSSEMIPSFLPTMLKCSE